MTDTLLLPAVFLKLPGVKVVDGLATLPNQSEPRESELRQSEPRESELREPAEA